MKWLVVIAGILCNASASVLVKIAMSGGRPSFSVERPWALLANVPLVLGVALYASAFVLYAMALTKLPLNVAHPLLTSGAIAAVALCSVLLLGEQFYWTTAAGIALILAGVWLIAVRA